MIGLMPPVPLLVAAIREHGSPLRDDLVPGVIPTPGKEAREIALLTMVGDGFRVVKATRGGRRIRLPLTELEDVDMARHGPCLVLSNAGRQGALTVSVPGGTHIRMHARSAVAGAAVLGREFRPSRTIDLELAAGTPVDVVVPDVGDGAMWQVRLEVPGVSGRVSVCEIRLA